MSLDQVVRILIWAIEPTVPIRFQPFGAIRLKPFQTARRIVPRDRHKNRGSQTLLIRVWDPPTLANQGLPLKVPTARERQYNQSALPISGTPNLWP